MAKEDGITYRAYGADHEVIWEANLPVGVPCEPPSNVLSRAVRFVAVDPQGFQMSMEVFTPNPRLRRAYKSGEERPRPHA